MIRIQSISSVETMHWFQYKEKNLSEKFIRKVFFKLMNNSVFGKTMENICKRVEVRLIQTVEIVIKTDLCIII